MHRYLLLLGLALGAGGVSAEGLGPNTLGIIYNRDDESSRQIAAYYAAHRHVAASNVLGLMVPDRAIISRTELEALRRAMQRDLPASVQSLLLVWSRPYAAECMSITTAVAAGYRPEFCEPGCGRTALNPLYDAPGWLPADTVGWLPAMLLPSADEALARLLIDRGIESDGTRPAATAYLVRTQDRSRNVRASGYADTEQMIGRRLAIRELVTPVKGPIADVIAYFTGVPQVEELSVIKFRPGAVADHLTSLGGRLDGSSQMPALNWLRQGATASYGTVSEPCNLPGKFPNPTVFLDHYTRGDSILEAYWKSVAMPGQGLFIGEPLAAPYRGS